MPAYVIVEIDIKDPVSYEDYKKLTPASIAAYGGKFIVRGAKTECLEGDWNPMRLVVLEFPTLEQAKSWWASPEYADAKMIRQRSAKTQMIVVNGAGA